MILWHTDAMYICIGALLRNKRILPIHNFIMQLGHLSIICNNTWDYIQKNAPTYITFMLYVFYSRVVSGLE